MSHWISSIIKHCCLLHSKGRLPPPISPSEILLLSSNNLFHPEVVKKKLKQWLVYVHSTWDILSLFLWAFADCTNSYFMIQHPFFQMRFLNALSYLMCVYHHHFYGAPYSFSHGVWFAVPLDIIDVIFRNHKDNNITLLLSAYVELCCWNQSFTLRSSAASCV